MSENDQLGSVVVLGATGFVGRRVCRTFRAGGTRVLGVGRSARPGDPDFEPLALDLSAAPLAELTGILAERRPDAVVNAAGAVWGVTQQQLDDANVSLTERLIEAVAALPDRPRLVHLGSVHEYGQAPYGEGISEDRAAAPVSPYGRSKLLGSEAVLAATAAGRIDAVVLRIVNVYGPDSPSGSLLGMIGAHLAAVRRAREEGVGEPLMALSPLRAHRDFVDVRDVAAAVVAAASAPLPGAGPEHRLINIGRGAALDIRGLVDRLIELSGLDPAVIQERADDGGRKDVEWQQVDALRAHRLLGWTPRHDVEESLRDLLTSAA